MIERWLLTYTYGNLKYAQVSEKLESDTRIGVIDLFYERLRAQHLLNDLSIKIRMKEME